MICYEQKSQGIREFVKIFSKILSSKLLPTVIKVSILIAKPFPQIFISEMLLCIGIFSIQSIVLMTINKAWYSWAKMLPVAGFGRCVCVYVCICTCTCRRRLNDFPKVTRLIKGRAGIKIKALVPFPFHIQHYVRHLFPRLHIICTLIWIFRCYYAPLSNPKDFIQIFATHIPPAIFF